ncbi:MAG TPA: hypothetical protein VMH02_09225 [Verrucomicrobiae bacterium]|nr:hypothetical protein [Verrucomicrobiae bacterium]
MISLLRICATLLVVCALVPWPGAAAPAPMSAIAGRILETSAGLPVAGARVELRRGTTVVATANTAAGELHVEAGQAMVQIQTALTPTKAGLKEIAAVTVSGTGALQTSATLNNNLSPTVVKCMDISSCFYAAGFAAG